jgi:hypothetical protein
MPPHCDSLDGPVVAAAAHRLYTALQSGPHGEHHDG